MAFNRYAHAEAREWLELSERMANAVKEHSRVRHGQS